jgi:predicted DNA-binding mobile mystery protein A
MNIKEIVTKQYREIIDGARSKVVSLKTPPEGWLRTNRKALKLPVNVILSKSRIKKSELYRIEKAELDGTLTLNKLKEAANSMGCDLYYAIVPRDNIDSIIKERAKRHAVNILKNADIQMQLEEQATTTEQIEHQVNKVTEDLIRNMPEWFWE